MKYRVLHRPHAEGAWVVQRRMMIHAHDQLVDCYADVMACRYVHDALDCAERLEDGRMTIP